MFLYWIITGDGPVEFLLYKGIHVVVPLLVMFIELSPDHWACCYSTSAAVEVPQHSDNMTKCNSKNTQPVTTTASYILHNTIII